jgi:hypothetical protein
VRALVPFTVGLVLSACGSSVGIGDPCSLDDPCDEGVCNLSGAADPVCVDADGDLDGDGQPNRTDFCSEKPGGPLDAFDEDGDGQGDNCDACPIAPPPTRPDSDTDGVDAPCDPEPSIGDMTKGNKIVLFDGFNGGLPATLSKREGGTWEVRGGTASFTATDPTSVGIFTVTLPTLSQHLAVQAAYRVDRVDAAANQNLAGVTSIARLPLGLNTVSCSGSRIGGMDSLIVNAEAGNMSRPFLNLFDPAGFYRIAALIEGATGSCAMRANTQEGGVSATVGSEAATEAGLTARATDVRFQYLLIVQRPN